jgi:hypothetical protein
MHAASGREPGQLSHYSDQGVGWTTEEGRFSFHQGQGIFLRCIASRSAPGPTQPPIQMVLEAVPVGAGI